jgi:crossover junction endodeoxyribonuclease RuvC
MRIIGIDPGTRVIGYGVVETSGSGLKALGWGAIDVRGKKSLPERLAELFKHLSRVLSKYKPDCAVVEKIFFAKSADSAIKIGEGRGVAILAAALHKIPVTDYSATVIKKSVTGTGGAHKSQVQNMVKVILGLKSLPQPLDAADALACAICHCHRIQFSGALD